MGSRGLTPTPCLRCSVTVISQELWTDKFPGFPPQTAPLKFNQFVTKSMSCCVGGGLTVLMLGERKTEWGMRDLRVTAVVSLVMFLTVSSKQDPKSIQCYHEVNGDKFQQCHKDDGFETCFSKYDHNRVVILRGCSSKKKMFHVECENHISGTRNEQFCYCSYDLCNSSSGGPRGCLLLLLLLLFLSLILSNHNCIVNYLNFLTC